MSLDLAHVIESAADEVASAGRAAAGSINELVHEWGHETRSFVSDHAPSLPIGGSRKRSSKLSWRMLVPVLVLGVVAFVVVRRKRSKVAPHLQAHETIVTSSPNDERSAAGAAAS